MKRMFATLFLAVTVVLGAVLPGMAQSRKDNWENLKQLQAGHKVKVVEMDLKAWDGRLVSVSDEAITIREKRQNQEITVDRAKVLRVTDLHRSRRGRNALLGFAAGAALGFALLGRGDDEAAAALYLFGGSGAALGAAIPHPRPTIYATKVKAEGVGGNTPSDIAGENRKGEVP